jgi:ectoine hydroxylase-related dioxygenase (phytanoyl-CoA dioxygenase family)
MTEPLSTFGVKEFTQVGSDVDRAVEAIRIAGYSVVHEAVSQEDLATARRKMDEVYAVQVAEIGGEELLGQINDGHTARVMFAYDEFFLGIATNRKVRAIVEAFLGDYYTLMLQNGLLNRPVVGHHHAGGQWHRDLNYQHYFSSRPLSISALFCIDDFREENGGTHVLTGSHKTEPFPSVDYVRAHETVLNAPAGSVLVFDSMLYHRGGVNRTGGVRRAINHMYTLPLIRQQISFPKMLQGKYRDDPFLGKFLGYEAEAAASVVDFRKIRLARHAAMAAKS